TAFVLTACASDPALQLSKSAEEDYNKAQVYMDNENYGQAILFLEKFSAKYPYSKYASKAEKMRVEASYLDNQYILSETLGLRFMSAHPDHQDRVRVQFLVAMSYYKQSHSADLDQQYSHRSHDAFVALNQQFPNNAFAQETAKYLNIMTNRIAEHEIIVGKFYFDNERYIAAINRFTLVKNDYLGSKFVDEALYYLVATYIAVDQVALANETYATLKSKFPQSNWFKKATALL
ncbi:MAG: outer membrane protein assembly factor BamD, partial [Ghiorsea sp.]